VREAIPVALIEMTNMIRHPVRIFAGMLCTAIACPAIIIAAPQYLPGVPVGTVANQISEVSGLADSALHSGVLWAHNDSGDSARFYAMSHDGQFLAQFSLEGVLANDWEDMAILNSPSGASVYIGDIGDNDLDRSSIAVYRVPEPQSLSSSATISAASIVTSTFTYQGARRNAEALLVDPRSGDAFVVSKNSLIAEVFHAPASALAASSTSQLVTLGTLGSGIRNVSAADISPDGSLILVRNRTTTAYLFERGAAESVWDALLHTPTTVTLRSEAQGEAIAWAANGQGFFTTSEFDGKGPQPIYYYAAVPEPTSLATSILGVIAATGAASRGLRRHMGR
jgi:hypothetical protein